MILWTFLIENLSKIGTGVFGAIGLLLYGRNSKLVQENASLRQGLKIHDKIIDIQKKVINVTQNTSATDLDGNLERMHDDKL